MFVMFVCLLLPLRLLSPGEMRPHWVGGVDVLNDVVRVGGQGVVTPAQPLPAHPLLLQPLTTGTVGEEGERGDEIFPVHCSVIRPSLSVLIMTLTLSHWARPHTQDGSLPPPEHLELS